MGGVIQGEKGCQVFFCWALGDIVVSPFHVNDHETWEHLRSPEPRHAATNQRISNSIERCH
jgi:hypothetical protein